MKISPRMRLQGLAILGGAVVVLGVSLFTRLLAREELRAQDTMTALRATEVDDSLVLLGIDEPSMNVDTLEPEEIAASRALDLMRTTFPWSREVYGYAIRRVIDAGARVVILDLTFPGPGARGGDSELAAAISESGGRVVLGSNYEIPKSSQQGQQVAYTPPTRELAAAAGDHVGYVNLPAPIDSAIRWFRPYSSATVFGGSNEYLGDDVRPALTTVAARILGFAPEQTPEPELLRFHWLKPGSIPIFPLYEIFVPKIWERNYKSGAVFKDKTVVIGPTAEIMKDILVTPLGRVPGPEVHLNILSAVRRNAWFYTFPPIWGPLSVVIAAVAVLGLSVGRKRVTLFAAACVGLALGGVVICWFVLVATSWFLPVAHPVITLAVCMACALVADVSMERRERGRMRSTLERYVSRDVVREIVDNPSSYLQSIGGKRKDIVILFSDLKGFTSDAEGMDPAVLVALLNEYFSEMVDAVFTHKGTLDKFIGDAIMATWGGLRDVSASEEAREALRAVFEMRDRLAALNARRAPLGVPAWNSGIGLAQGPAVFGTLGSQQKMEPTVIGDTVNLASRIEGLTRSYDCPVLVNARIAKEAVGECEFTFLDEVRVKGRKQSEKLYFPHRETLAWSEPFSEARELYVAGKFSPALNAFTRLNTTTAPDGLVKLYTRRCTDFLASPPPEDWGGVWGFSEK